MEKYVVLALVISMGLSGMALFSSYLLNEENEKLRSIVMQHQEYTRDLTDYIVNFNQIVGKKLELNDKLDLIVVDTFMQEIKRIDEKIAKLRK